MRETRTESRWRIRQAIPVVGGLVVVILCSGCVLVNQEKSDPVSMVEGLPKTWTGDGPAVSSEAATGWISDFSNDQLVKLVREAVDENYDLAATLERVYQAGERVKIEGAARFPDVESRIGTSRSQNLRGANFRSVRANNFNLSLNLSWEIDVWGRIKNLRDSELDRLDSQVNLYQASRLSLAANVAKTAFQIIESQKQIELTKRTIDSLQTNLEILDAKLEAGDADDRTALEISLSRADVARARANLVFEQRELDGSKRILETLLGRYPAGTIESLRSIPTIAKNVPAGLPSELLLRRPDLLAAEAQVDAALKELAASRKALLPAFAITGAVGNSSTDEFAEIFDIQNLVWNVGANLTQPLFAGGRIRANIRLDEHEKNELVLSYAETAMTAFREVETALAAETYLTSQAAALAVAVRESKRAEDLSRSQYEDGLVDIITLLESQRRSFDTQSNYLSVRLQLLQNRVDLYLALGGDFDTPMEIPVAPLRKKASEAVDSQ